MTPVDIIIPVYNGYDDIRLCMASILQHTDLTQNRVILVNDKSPDERIVPLLKSYLRGNVELIDSEVNSGFSASVNKGMCYSKDRDVILLNSDTIVTERWVEKITTCAYSADEIGTVTPLSNSATLCSVPVMCQDNQIPDGFTVDSYAHLVERCSLRKYPRITVAVGFCMFIKREVIQKVGLFDAETFGRGYGEENDFCNRAGLYGYCNVMCDDTFIYHKGTASFDTEEKRRLIEAHEQILQERYPLQMEENHLYCVNNPDQFIRDNISLYAEIQNGRKNILYLLQSDFRADFVLNPGGTELHVRDLVRGFKNQCNIFVLCRSQDDLCLSIYHDDVNTLLRFPLRPVAAAPVYTDRHLKELFTQILSAFRVDLVHIHHVLRLSLDMFYCAYAMNIPVIATLHDYYYVCPTIKLLDDEDAFCGGCVSVNRCAQCLKKQAQIATQVDYITQWRSENEKALALCEQLVVPSKAAAEIYAAVFPSLADRIHIIEHGSDFLEVDERKVEIGAVEPTDTAHICIDYLFNQDSASENVSGWAFIEGADTQETEVLLELTDCEGKQHYTTAKRFSRPDVQAQVADGGEWCSNAGFTVTIPRYRCIVGSLRVRVLLRYQDRVYTDGIVLTIDSYGTRVRGATHGKDELRVGFIGGMVPAKGSTRAYELITNSSENIHWYIFGTIGDPKLAQLKRANLTKLGSYERDEIYQLLRDYQIDLVCILPTWAETFCYTLSEAWLGGVPVLVTDMGAVGDRVRSSGAGVIVSGDASVDEILSQIDLLHQQPEILQKMRDLLNKKTPVRSIDAMVEDYRKLYRPYMDAEHHYGVSDVKVIFSGWERANRKKRIAASSKTVDYVKYLRVSQEQDALLQMQAELQTELNRITNSVTFRFARWLSRVLHFWRRG